MEKELTETREKKIGMYLGKDRGTVFYRTVDLGGGTWGAEVFLNGEGGTVICAGRDRAEELLDTLASGLVTPTTLPDIADDLDLLCLPTKPGT